MEQYHQKAVDALLSQKKAINATDLVSKCIVQSTQEISSMNVALLAWGRKPIDDEMRGTIYEHLAALTNLIMILYHVTETEIPEEDDMIEFAEQYPVDYANDGILAGLYSLASITNIAAVVYDMDIGSDPEAPSKEEALEIVDTNLAEIYAGIVVCCQLYDIDFEELLVDASKKKAWR